MEGTWGQELKQNQEQCCLLACSTYQPRGGTTHNAEWCRTSHINQENAPTDLITDQFDGGIVSVEGLCSEMTTFCQVCQVDKLVSTPLT